MATTLERIKQFIDQEGISVSAFEKSVGFSNGAFASQLKNKKTIGVDKLENILNNFPQLNPSWILTGEDDMILENYIQKGKISRKFSLKTDNAIERQRIPLYDIEAVAGLIPLFDNPAKAATGEYIVLPRVPKCDGAIFVTGDSMYPLLKSGDIVAYRKIQDFSSEIFWGEMYLVSVEVANEEYISVKYIQKSDKGEQYIKLVSENKHHQPKDVHLNKVRVMALVKASVRINSMG